MEKSQKGVTLLVQRCRHNKKLKRDSAKWAALDVPDRAQLIAIIRAELLPGKEGDAKTEGRKFQSVIIHGMSHQRNSYSGRIMRHRIILDFFWGKKRKKAGIFGHLWGTSPSPFFLRVHENMYNALLQQLGRKGKKKRGEITSYTFNSGENRKHLKIYQKKRNLRNEMIPTGHKGQRKTIHRLGNEARDSAHNKTSRQ